MADSGSGSEYASWDRARLQDFRRELQRDLGKPLPKQYDPGSDIKDRWRTMIREINAELEFREDRRRSRPPAGRDNPPSPLRLAGDALRNYFARNNISPGPRYETVRIDLSWNQAGQAYRGIYNLATRSLQVWMKVPAGTEGAVIMGGEYYVNVA